MKNTFSNSPLSNIAGFLAALMVIGFVFATLIFIGSLVYDGAKKDLADHKTQSVDLKDAFSDIVIRDVGTNGKVTITQHHVLGMQRVYVGGVHQLPDVGILLVYPQWTDADINALVLKMYSEPRVWFKENEVSTLKQ